MVKPYCVKDRARVNCRRIGSRIAGGYGEGKMVFYSLEDFRMWLFARVWCRCIERTGDKT